MRLFKLLHYENVLFIILCYRYNIFAFFSLKIIILLLWSWYMGIQIPPSVPKVFLVKKTLTNGGNCNFQVTNESCNLFLHRKSSCFNCGGDHIISKCPEEKDFERIRRNKKEFLANSTPRQT